MKGSCSLLTYVGCEVYLDDLLLGDLFYCVFLAGFAAKDHLPETALAQLFGDLVVEQLVGFIHFIVIMGLFD